MQVLHSSPELGGDAVQEPYEGTPGIYVGTAHTSHVQPLLTMDLQALVHGSSQWSHVHGSLPPIYMA